MGGSWAGAVPEEKIQSNSAGRRLLRRPEFVFIGQYFYQKTTKLGTLIPESPEKSNICRFWRATSFLTRRSHSTDKKPSGWKCGIWGSQPAPCRAREGHPASCRAMGGPRTMEPPLRPRQRRTRCQAWVTPKVFVPSWTTQGLQARPIHAP